ncbi:MAG TPA: tyrosine-type recombinase/integrase [Pseudonocardia sp.]
MGGFDQLERDIAAICLPVWGRVIAADGVVPWLVIDPTGEPVEPITRFLRDFVARGNRAGSVRSYAFDLLRWWRFLRAVDVEWDKATSAEVRDFVLWFGQARKPRRATRTTSARTAGAINPVTRKRNLDDGYTARTVRHSNAVLRSFYDYWLELGQGPLVNPVPVERAAGRRPNAHHNPLAPYRAEGRLRFNPKLPRSRPRAMPDQRWNELFSALRSNRDRALLSMAASNGARAGELLGLRGADLDWGDQLVRVHRKGSGAQQWLPASSETFVWLRLYLADLAEPLGADDPVWWTLRRRDHGAGPVRQVLTYEALRAVFRRVNTLLGTNWTMHDLRHTSALRMARDPDLSMRDVQLILGHAHLATTAGHYLIEEETQVIRRVAQHLAQRRDHAGEPPAPVAAGYDSADLEVLFGSGPR